MTKAVLILSTDRIRNGMGGLSTQLRQTFAACHTMCLPFKFYVAAPGESEMWEEDNVVAYPLDYSPPLTMQQTSGYLAALNMNSSYMLCAMQIAEKHGKPSLIHAFDWATAQTAEQLSRYWGVPWVFTVALSLQLEVTAYRKHHPQAFDSQSNYWPILDYCIALETTAILKASRIVLCSRRYAQNVAMPMMHKVSVVPNGIPMAMIDAVEVPPNLEWPSRPGARKLVYIGRLAVSKNIAAVVRASLPPNVDLCIIGSTENGGAEGVIALMKEHCKTRDDVHFMGPKYEEEKFRYLKDADAVIMPSIHEPFGIVALEAMASGATFLCSMVDGLADFVDTTVAIQCGTTPETITEALAQWAAMSPSEEQAMRQRARERAAKYSWEKVALMVGDIYDKMLMPAISKPYDIQ